MIFGSHLPYSRPGQTYWAGKIDRMSIDQLTKELPAIGISIDNISEQLGSLVDAARAPAGQSAPRTLRSVDPSNWLAEFVAMQQGATDEHRFLFERPARSVTVLV
jgi:hypothetical protein